MARWASTGAAHRLAYDTAIEEQSPIIGIWHSGGARLAEGVKALHAVGLMFEAMIRASGYVPQISVVVGFAAGGAAYGPALTDVVIMAPEGRVFVTGPDIVRSVTGEDVDMASLGGPDTHHKKSGVCHIVADDELDAYERGRRLIGLFCQQGHFDRSKAEAGDTDLHALLPDSSRRAYDVHPLINALLDADTPFEEFQAKWAPSMVVGLGRLAGRQRRRARQQPAAPRRLPELRECREGSAFRAAVRRVRHSAGRRGRRARLPARRRPGVGRRGAPRRQAAARVRRGDGSARHAGHQEDLRRRLHRDELAVAERHQGVRLAGRRGRRDGRQGRGRHPAQAARWPPRRAETREALHEELAAEHERIAGGVDSAIEIGVVDAKIDPAHTRSVLTQALAEAPARRGRHKNIPL